MWTGWSHDHTIASDLPLALNVQNRICVASSAEGQQPGDVVPIVARKSTAQGRSDSSRYCRVVNWSHPAEGRNRANESAR